MAVLHLRFSRRFASICIWGALTAASALAQTTFGSITGVITDPSGAAVPQAQVIVTNQDTNLVRRQSTSSAGVYTVPDLIPGRYSVRAEAAGFTPGEKNDVVLDANHVVTADFRLNVGVASSHVDVQAEAPVITTETATTSYVKTETELLDSALEVRQGNTNQGFVMYNPGVGVNDSGNYAGPGARQVDTYWTNDGIVEMQDLSGSGGSGIGPDLEGVAEINYVLVDAPAEFKGATTVTTVSKSGTNNLHGSLYYDYNGNALNARDFFASTVPFRVYNDFAASVGGPIRKNKTFFFADYEGSFDHGRRVITDNTPLASWQTGNFSNLLPDKVLTNPFTGQPFAGNIIPSSLISPVSQKLQQEFYPQPNCGGANATAGNWCGLLPSHTDFKVVDGRIDHYFSERDTIFGRYSYHRMNVLGQRGNLPPVGTYNQQRNSGNAMLSYTHTFSAALLNEFRAGYSRDTSDVSSTLQGDQIVSDAGIAGIATTGIPGQPTLSITGITGTSSYSIHDKALTNYQWTDNLSWTTGRHAFKFGADFVHDAINQNYLPNNLYGSFNFTGRYTGSAYADFLLGLPQKTGVSDPAPSSYLRGTMAYFYAQDQFKVSQRLTLTYGVRWELSTPYHDKFGRIFSYDPAAGALVVPDSGLKSVNPLFPSTVPILTASQAHYPSDTLLQFPKANIYPRVGIAYKLTSDGKTVVRAGYGLYGNTIYGTITRSMEGGPFGGSETFFNTISGGVPLLTMSSPFVPQAGQVAAFEDVSGFNPKLKIPYLQQWNITVERQIGSVGLSVAYVGSHAVNLLYGRNINQPPPSTTPFDISRLPNPNFNTITWFENGASQKYNSLQVAANKRLSKGLLFSAGWTWASDLTDQSDDDWVYADNPIQNQFDRRAEWGHNAFTPTHRFFADAVYALPIGRGRTFLRNMPGFVEAVAGGWRLSGVVTLQTGQWFTPTFDGFDPSNTNTIGGRPDVVPGVPLYPAHQTIDNWFNVNAFAIPGCPASNPVCDNPANIGRFGNAGVNILQTPGMRNLDLSLMKEFTIAENKILRFQATASNVLNHPNFGYPDGDISSPDTAAVITSTNGNYLSGSSTARQINFALRFQF
ncbi:MAG TPA: TonB-dependent receptor [Bryobacteraceae bacterium]|nr:TonB-dependent receptor [Bryobacteraceae bacterium]